jgi:hypothetical protein
MLAMSASRLSLRCPTGIICCPVLVRRPASLRTTPRPPLPFVLVFGLAGFTVPFHDLGHVLVLVLRELFERLEDLVFGPIALGVVDQIGLPSWKVDAR